MFPIWHNFSRFMFLNICCYTFATRLQCIVDYRKCNRFQRQLRRILDVGNCQRCCQLSYKISSRVTIGSFILFKDVLAFATARSKVNVKTRSTQLSLVGTVHLIYEIHPTSFTVIKVKNERLSYKLLPKYQLHYEQ